MSQSPLIRYVGLLRSPASWARVGRHLVLALDALGARVTVAHRKGYLFDSAFSLPARLLALQGASGEADVDLAFLHPSLYTKLRAPVKVGMLTWESSVMPADWAAAVDEHLDMLLVPSQFVADAARAAGVIDTPIRIVPYGVDTDMFHPRACAYAPQELLNQASHVIGAPIAKDRLADCFLFLTIGAPHYRKGLLEIAAGFAHTFAREDSVVLIIKTTNLTSENSTKARLFEIPHLREKLEQALAGTGLSILLFDQALPDDGLAWLYASADAYVCASFGEGFGLSVLEAKGTALPTAAPLWGGLADFCTEADTWPIAFTLEHAGKSQYHGVSDAHAARPQIESIAAVMREMRRIGPATDPRVARSLELARAFSWRRCAEGVLGAVEECLARRP